MKRTAILLAALALWCGAAAQQTQPPRFQGADAKRFMARLMGETEKLAIEKQIPASELSPQVVVAFTVDTAGRGGRVAFPGQYLSGARQMRCRARDGAYEAARDRGVGAPRSVDAGPEGRSVRKLYLAADDAPSGGEDRQAAGGRPVAVHGRRPRRDFPRMGAGAAALRRAVLLARRGRLVHVRFYIEPDGKVTIGEVLSSPDEKLSREVIRVIKASKGHWVPAACAACRSGRPTSTGSISPDPCGAGLRAA